MKYLHTITLAFSLLLCSVLVVGCATQQKQEAPASLEELESTLEKLDLTHKLNLAKIKHSFTEEKAAGALNARRDLIASTKRIAAIMSWVFGALLLVSLLGMLLGSTGVGSIVFGMVGKFIPIGHKAAGLWVGCLAGTILFSYILQRYGPSLADWSFWILLAGSGLAFLTIGVPMFAAWVRARLMKQSNLLVTKGETRPAAALASVALGATTEKPKDVTKRKQILFDIEASVKPTNNTPEQ